MRRDRTNRSMPMWAAIFTGLAAHSGWIVLSWILAFSSYQLLGERFFGVEPTVNIVYGFRGESAHKAENAGPPRGKSFPRNQVETPPIGALEDIGVEVRRAILLSHPECRGDLYRIADAVDRGLPQSCLDGLPSKYRRN